MKKKLSLGIVILAILFVLVGCGRSSSTNMMTSDMAAAEAYPEEGMIDAGGGYMSNDSYDESGKSETAAQQDPSRKLITNMNISAETENFDTLLNTVEERVTELGGYVESSDLWNGSYDSDSTRSMSLTIRIPAEKLDHFVTTIAEKSNITNQSKSVQDVTLTYVDLESHKSALEAEENRLLELMEQAQTMEDIISIEDKLTEVRYQLQSMESQLRTYDNQINYSTVYLDIQEVERMTPAPEQTIWGKISSGFSNSLYQVGKDIQNVFVNFMINLPFIIVWAMVLAIAILIGLWIAKCTRKHNEKSRARLMEQRKQMQQTTKTNGEKNDSTEL